MFVTPLNTRGKKVLQAIVESYIETASPVSSQTITQRFRSRSSPATIRNVMGQLDEMGLVWQPHTSAGRIPTDEGYRYYIDWLLEIEQLTLQERELIQDRYPADREAFDELLTEMLRILSNFSGYTALAFSSGLRRILFKRLELVSLEGTKLLVVLVSLGGLVKTVVVQMPYKIGQPELLKIARFLNEELTGLTLDEIKEQLSLRLLARQDAFFYLLKAAAEILNLTFASFEKDKLYLEGTSYILKQPEFQNTRKLQVILRAFEKQEPLLKIMKEDLDPDGIKVHIGKENPCEEIRECSLVISNFKIKNRNIGTLGIIGPRRMFYSKVISAVSYMARILGERITDSNIRFRGES